MVARPNRVRQSEVKRVLRATQAAGYEVVHYEVDFATGKMSITTRAPGAQTAPNELDNWLASHAPST